jgi:hypothetical protein
VEIALAANADLASLVNAQAPPLNPATANTRTNPEHDWFVALQVVRTTASEAHDKAEQRGPEVQAILDATRTAMSRLLAGVDPKAVAASMASEIAKPIAPLQSQQLQAMAAQLSAPAIAPAGGGAPVSPFGAGPAAPPLTMPSMPPAPGAPPNGGATAGGPPPVSPGVALG